MECINADTADMAWRQASALVNAKGRMQEGRDQPTREVLHVGFTIKDPRQRVIFARPINPAFAIVEVIWILAGFDGLDFLMPWNPRMRNYSDDSKTLRGAYGYRLGSHLDPPTQQRDQVSHPLSSEERPLRLNQIKAAFEALQVDPNTRQIVLQIWEANLDLPNPLPRSRDVPCNIISHIMIRDGKLEWLQVMRSNDLIWGTPYNFIQFTTIQEIMAGWLNIDVGTYSHISDSLHVYERHWTDLEVYERATVDVPINTADLRIPSYEEWVGIWTQLVGATLQLASASDFQTISSVLENQHDLPPSYQEWVRVLTAEKLRQYGFQDEADNVIEFAGSYWSTSWRLWRDSKLGTSNIA